MFSSRVLTRIATSSSSSSSLVSLSRLSSCSSSLRSPLLNSSSLIQRSFSNSAVALNATPAENANTTISTSGVAALVNGDKLPESLTADAYSGLLKSLEDFKPHIPKIQSDANFLSPDREDPAVNNAILELHSEAFESDWDDKTRKQVGEWLQQEYRAGGDAALVIAINQLLAKRVTFRNIVDNLGGWYPLAGLAAIIAISKELIIVNEELLMVTNFLAVFGGLYFQLHDTILDQYRTARAAEGKKYEVQRQLEIDVSKALLAAYDRNPKVVELIDQLKADVNHLIKERSRAKFVKKKAEIQRQFMKALDTVVTAEAQAEGKVKKQILERFADYMHFMLTIHRIRNDGFFADGMITSLTQLLTGVGLKPEATPIGKLVKAYISNALWTVDWKNLKLGSWGEKFFGIYDDLKVVRTVAALKKLQNADFEKFRKENPNGTEADYYKARGAKGPQSLASFLKEEIKKNPERVKADIERARKENEAWKEELKRAIEAGKTKAQPVKTQKKEENKTVIDVEKARRVYKEKMELAEKLKGYTGPLVYQPPAKQ